MCRPSWTRRSAFLAPLLTRKTGQGLRRATCRRHRPRNRHRRQSKAGTAVVAGRRSGAGGGKARRKAPVEVAVVAQLMQRQPRQCTLRQFLVRIAGACGRMLAFRSLTAFLLVLCSVRGGDDGATVGIIAAAAAGTGGVC